MLKILKEKGYKKTQAREAILEIFTKTKQPLKAEEILKYIHKKRGAEKINETTIYRNLSSMEQSGIIRQVHLKKGSSYFELNDTHHHHIVCTKCDFIEDFENEVVEKALRRIVETSSKFKKIKEHSVELFGICTKCLTK